MGKQLEQAARMLHEKRLREINAVVSEILESLPEDHDPRETARRISEAVANLLDRRPPVQ